MIDGDENEKVGDYYFRTDYNGNHYLSAYIGKEETLKLPESYKGEKYGIDEYVFYDHDELVNVTIPGAVTSIDDYAFKDCDNLCVTFDNTVTKINLNAFDNSNLHSLTIGSSVTSITYESYSSLGSYTKPSITKTIWLTNTPPSGYKDAAGGINYVANEQYSSLSNAQVYPYLSSLFEVDGVKYVPVNMSERTCDAIDCRYDSSVENVAVNSTVSYRGVEMAVKEVMPYTFYRRDRVWNCNFGQ